MPRISLILPNYNREALMGEMISNLPKHTMPPHKIIVVDGRTSALAVMDSRWMMASRDELESILRRMDEPVRLPE